MIHADMEPRLFEYLGGIVSGNKARLLEINGTANHVHLLIRESKSVADQVFIGLLKGDSSRWVNVTLQKTGHFSWQNGYAWFSVGPADVNRAVNYIRKQKEHHQSASFENEYRQFLKKYEIEHDEQYLWD